MSSSIRTFIGIPVQPPAALSSVIDRIHDLGRGVKPVSSETMHITLKFLGDTPYSSVARLTDLIASVATKTKRLSVQLTGLSAFPDTARPSIIWAALQGAEEITSLAAELETALEPEGFAREGRTYTPHLTLARVRSLQGKSRSQIPPGVLELLDEHAETDFGSVTLDKVNFYESRLSDAGPTYTCLATVPLCQATER